MSASDEFSLGEIALLVAARKKSRIDRHGHYDIHDMVSALHPYTMGHAKWNSAQYCMTFIILDSLTHKGHMSWSGKSRALGRNGWHGGLWTITDKGASWADMYISRTNPFASK